MPIDPNIILGVRPPQIQQVDPLQRYGQILGIQGALGNQQLQGLQVQQARQGMADSDALRQATIEGAGDLTKTRAAIAASGNYKALMDFDKSQNDTRKTQSEIGKNEQDSRSKALDDAQKANDHIGSILMEVQKNPALYGSARNMIAQQYGPQAVADSPEQYDANFVASKIAAAQTLAQKLADQRAQEGQAITLRGQDLTSATATRGQDLSTQTARRGQDITLRGQNLTDARSRETLSQGKIPPGYRQNQDGTLSAIPGGPADLKLQGSFNQDTSALTSSTAAMDRLAAAANEAMNHPGLAGTTGLRGAIPNIPGSAAADAAALLNTLKSQVAFGVLQDMRNNSKTGGALGNVSDAEGKRLEANLAALEKSQSIDQLKVNLKKIVDYAEGAKDRLRGAYNLKHADNAATPTASVVTPTAKPTRVDSLSQADPAKYKGQVATGDDGIKYRSDGARWIRQ